MAKAAVSLLVPSTRTHVFSLAIRASQSMEANNNNNNNNNNVYKELGLFSLKKKIEDAVSRAEMTAPLALEVEEAKRIEQEEILMQYNLWDDLARSNESLGALANAIKVVNELKDLRYKAEEAKLISQLAQMDIINDQLFKQAYKASVDVTKFLDRYEMSKLLNGPFDEEGACLIITAGPEGITSEIWAESLLKMYTRWSKKHGCEGRIIARHPSREGGIKSATLEFEKEFVFGYLFGEKGVHKMIRSSLDGSVVRETRSACVDVIPLFLERPLDLHIDDKDMEISYQTSHYDESACRTEPVVSVHHIPSGITVKCSGERSHFANKMKALNRLKAKLLMLAMEQGVQDIDKIKSDSSTSLWKHEARRYMFRPHKLVQDVMTGVHLPDLNSVLNGNIEPLIRAHITLRQQTTYWRNISAASKLSKQSLAIMATPYIPMTPAAPVLERPVAVVGPQFCMPHPIDLSVTSKTLSLTDADFAVTDINGNLVFKVKGKFFSLHDKCALLDSIGNPVVSMQQKIWSAHRRWQVFRGGSTEAKDLLFSLKKSSFFQLRTELDVFLAANTNEGAPDFKIKGSFSERSCVIYLGETNTVLARMTTHETVKSIVLGKDIFGVTVYPNVDYAFIIALIVVLDQINQDRAD